MSAPSVSRSTETVRGLQERAARALPAEQVQHVGGWWLRHAAGGAWWVGSVLPHADAGPDELARRVIAVERFYTWHGTAARFQISPGACPEALDSLLAGRGYRRDGPMSLQVAAIAQVAAQPPKDALQVGLYDDPTSAWFEVRHAVHGHASDARAERDMLDRVELPSAYASAMIGDRVVAVGRAVVDEGWAGVFDLTTMPHARGKGAGRSILAALAGWGGARGADRLYLQVECDNIPALRLYERAGFGEVCRYHYRAAA